MTDRSHWDDGGLFDQLSNELARQDDLWGEQNHEDGTGLSFWREHANAVKESNARRVASGFLCWQDILEEEVAEAFAEIDPERLHEELGQVAAVALQWQKAIERRLVRA